MQKRRLGRTNLQVSQVGFGGTWIAQLSLDEAIEVVQTAFENGINYFDTARWDGDSEQKLGTALKDVRESCVIATKTGSRTKRESLTDLKESLSLLQTEKVD
ncbi:MAG: aldo/keto reductase, partial [Crenarchaeota archaeon]|nr:aldo/keto reductase [Thermoproteota archaeon]